MFPLVFPVLGTWHTAEVQQETGEWDQDWYHVVESVNVFLRWWMSLGLSLLVCVSSACRVRQAVMWKSRAALRRSPPNVFFSRGDAAQTLLCKNTLVLTGEKYKKQVFCLNLVDSINQIYEDLKGETETTGIIFVCICPFLPRMADNYLWSSYLILKCTCFPHWTYLLPTAPWKCWNLFCRWVVLLAAICNSATRCHQSCTLDRKHALTFWVFVFRPKLSYIIC